MKKLWGYLFSNHTIVNVGWHNSFDDAFRSALEYGEKHDAEPVHAIRDDVIDDLIFDLQCLACDLKDGEQDEDNE